MNTLRKIATFLLVLTWGISSGQMAQNEPLPLDPAIRFGKLANGFTYYIHKNAEPKDRVQLYLVNKVGSILENDDQLGLAHFIEHMSFNGTTHFPKNELVNYLQKAGVRFGADLNAYTSYDETVYQLPIPTDDPELFSNGMQIMRDWACEATLDETDIDQERGVILEEKRTGKGAAERIDEKVKPVLLNNSRYAQRETIGTEEVLKTFKPETLREFYHDWYRPDLQALMVVGDIDVDQVEKMIKEKFSDLKMPANPKVRTHYTIPLAGKNQFIAATDAEWSGAYMYVMIKHPEMVVKTSADFYENLKRSLFNTMLDSRYTELSNQPDPPFLSGGASVTGFAVGLDAFTAFIELQPGEFEKGFKAVWRETERLKQFGFTQTELDRAKENLMNSAESSFKEKDKTHSVRLIKSYVPNFTKGLAAVSIEANFRLVQQQLPGITLAEVNAVSDKYIVDVNRDVIIKAPDKDKNMIPDEATVNKWFADIKAEKLTAYVDMVSDKPLVEVMPKAGKIISEKKIDELKLTELTLSNGVKVILKPTDFRNNEIRFSATSPGGTSLYSDTDYESSAIAANIVSSSGLGNFTPAELSKLLSGKKANVTPFINDLDEGFYGFSTPKDFETALQLVYLYFTSPRKDTAIFNNLISRLKSEMTNRGNDPETVFYDTVSAVLANYNIRKTGPSLAKIEQVNLDKAIGIYKERFADASDFTFTLVGNIDIALIKPILEQWLGSLPTTKRKENYRDLGIHIPYGMVEKRVYKGSEEKAKVKLVLSGNYVYNQENNIQLKAIGEVLKTKLIERLREQEGGVYSPNISTFYEKKPRNTYYFNVEFYCSPDNADKLISATMEEINKIKSNGADSLDIQKFKAESTRMRETQLKDNGFWLNYVGSCNSNNTDPKEILNYTGLLNEMTPEKLKASANTYLNGKNIVKLVWLPEKGK